MIKRSRANTELPQALKSLFSNVGFFREYKNVYNIKTNILDNGSEKPN